MLLFKQNLSRKKSNDKKNSENARTSSLGFSYSGFLDIIVLLNPRTGKILRLKFVILNLYKDVSPNFILKTYVVIQEIKV